MISGYICPETPRTCRGKGSQEPRFHSSLQGAGQGWSPPVRTALTCSSCRSAAGRKRTASHDPQSQPALRPPAAPRDSDHARPHRADHSHGPRFPSARLCPSGEDSFLVLAGPWAPRVSLDRLSACFSGSCPVLGRGTRGDLGTVIRSGLPFVISKNLRKKRIVRGGCHPGMPVTRTRRRPGGPPSAGSLPDGPGRSQELHQASPVGAGAHTPLPPIGCSME